MKREHAYLAGALAALALLVPVQQRVDRQRELAAATSTSGVEIDPETYLTTVVLAGFRAIAIDIAWVRADYFERSGDLWAVAPTLELITDLQPTIEVVWNHIAWNLAFNLSLEERESDHEARWAWVDAAIRTLERGLVRNPRSYLIRQELGAWILFAKCVRTDLDDAAPYFAKRYRETRGVDPLTAVIRYLKEAREIPEHVEAVLPLCPILFHALEMRYDREVEAWRASPDELAWAKLAATREEMFELREHVILDHHRTRKLFEDSYPVPELPGSR